MSVRSALIQKFIEQRNVLHSYDPLSPLFILSDGQALSRTVLNKHIKQYLSVLGLDTEQYSGHSTELGTLQTQQSAACLIGRLNY